MVIGPWGHTNQESNFYNGEFMGEAADDINLEAEYIRWFDYWLKGKEKDKVVQYNFEMDPYGVKLDKGQKLGLIITSSFGYPFLTKNLNTGKNNQITTDYKIAEQKIYHTREYESYISLPILNNEIHD